MNLTRGTVRLALGVTLRACRSLVAVAAIIGALAVLVGAGFHIWGDIDVSVWEYVGTPLRWVLFVTGILATTGLLPLLVAHGLTRRTVLLAAMLAAGVVAAAGALFMAGGFLVERLVVGRDLMLSDTHLFGTATQAHLVLVEYTLVYAAYLVAGWLIGSGYYRLGALGGTVLLPLGAAVLIGVENVLGTGWRLALPALAGGAPDLPPAAAVAFAGAILAAGLVAVHLLVRTAPLPTRNA